MGQGMEYAGFELSECLVFHRYYYIRNIEYMQVGVDAARQLGMAGRGWGVWGLGFGVWGLGFGVWGLGFGVWGLGFGELGSWG
jgi:hypothetical protein